MKKSHANVVWAVAGLAVAVGCIAVGCGAPESDRAEMLRTYREALARTAPTPDSILKRGSVEEAAAVERFRAFYKTFTADAIRDGLRTLYAPDAYVADPLKTVVGLEAIEKYFLDSTETFDECRFDIEDPAQVGGDYFFPWTMHLILTRARDEPIEAIGVTHVRFNRDGQVVFHQDYWDAAGSIYEQLPIIGGVLRRIRARM
jgi:hypothetical protein